MENVIDLAQARIIRKPAITTGTRRNTLNTRPVPTVPSAVDAILERAAQLARIRKGDIVETTLGRALILNDCLLASCGGERFFLKPDHIALPEHGVC